ncbi:hypothetical protein AV944_11175 [Sphingomonas sp. LK11]|uniref:hypothetical protein n=1 Tax=Sphingomonas sp. LK11 TaxID=1390395 RepID=UPI000972A1D8|nr:hypothetical protein [Sphingomonas sp. LK11]APX66300.1 hypothetical protein AV944_11175 [Sphingomonas sp. LK11]
MRGFDDPVAVLRQRVKDMQWQAEKLRRDARDLELRAGEIHNASIELDLLTDKIEAAQPKGDPA